MKRVVLLSVCVLCHFYLLAQGVNFEPISLERALERAKSENKLVLVDVTASWCAPCQMMANEILVQKEVGDYCNEHFICIQMDVDQPAGKAFKKEHGIKYIPMFFILEPDGGVRHRLQGTRSSDDFLDWARRGVNKESSLLNLESLSREGKEMSVQNKVDYYMVLKDTREQQKADSVREALFAGLSPDEMTEPACWALFRDETYGSKYFDHVVEHAGAFKKKLGAERLDAYLVQVYKQAVQQLMYNEVRSPEDFELIAKLTRELSSETPILGAGDKAIVLAWIEVTKAFLDEDIPGMVKGIGELAELKEWRDCLWKVLVYVGTKGDDAQHPEVGVYTATMLFDFSRSSAEQWDFYQKFKYLHFPIACNKQFWENASGKARKENKPLLVECVRCSDAYYMNRNWMWDSPALAAYLDSVCVSVRIDMEAEDVAFLREKFKITTYPAYFLLDADGGIKTGWEGMITEDQLFRESLDKGLKE